MPTLGNIATQIEPVRSDAIGEAIFERFSAAPQCTVIPVVDSFGYPVGLIERDTFLTQLAGPFGRSIYGNRPISIVMDKKPLTVEAETNAGDFAATAVSACADQLLKGFIIVERGRYIGVGTMVDLLRAAAVERGEAAQRLSALAESLRQSNLDAERQRRLAEAVIEHIPTLVAVRTGDTKRFVLLNKAGEAILGVDRQSFVDRTRDDLRLPELVEQIGRSDAILDELPPASPREMQYTRPSDGETRLLRIAQMPIEMPDGKPILLSVGEDVTETRRAVARIEQLAHFDILTGLPNRALFHERLEAALDCADRVVLQPRPSTPADAQIAVLAIDVDRFKAVNDTFGHAAGDLLLKTVAERLRSLGFAARLGGDEFAVLLFGPDVGNTANATAAHIVEALAEPFDLNGQTVYAGASVGIAVYPDDTTHRADLLRHADVALYRAKTDGRGVWRRYNPTLHSELQSRRALEQDLRDALGNGEIEAHFQPFHRAKDNQISGFEALMRWRHPRLGYVPPATFIPVAEDIGLIGTLGEWMINESCRVAATLPPELTVAVNISAPQFRMAGLVATIMRALAKAGVPGERLEIEVTESVLMQDEPQVLKSVRQLRDLGIRLSLDDFGTGYASLSTLQRFPFDKIKIDQSFIRGLPDDKPSVAIIAAVTAMARQLGMVTTAEGVETEAQRAAVEALGCIEIQGFLLGAAHPDPVRLVGAEATRPRIARAG